MNTTYTAADVLKNYGLPASGLPEAMKEGFPQPIGANAASADLWDAHAVDAAIKHSMKAFGVVGRKFASGELKAGEVDAELRTLRAIRGILGGAG